MCRDVRFSYMASIVVFVVIATLVEGVVYVVNPIVYDINSDVGKLKVVELGAFVLKLAAADGRDLFHPPRSEWHSDEGVAHVETPNCHFKSGRVENEPNSVAAISLCDSEVIGFFTYNSEVFFVEPANSTHIVYSVGKKKRSVNKWEYFNLTGDTFDAIPENNVISAPNFHSNWRREEIDDEELGYFFDTAWQPNYITSRKAFSGVGQQTRWLEIAVAIDHSVVAFHGKSRVESYVLSLMNIVNAIYRDPSLGANLQLVITKLLVYDHKRHSVVRPGNAKKSLENVNVWNKGLHASLAPGEVHHDVAVWLTRSDIGGPSGYAPVSGACDPERSCALNRDEGLTSAFIIAHEMAHILGLSHDGDTKASNDCREEALQGSVMAPMVSSTFHQFQWSPCSRDEFKVNAKKWKCLLNAPSGSGEITLNATLQTSFSMDEQCRMEFGEGYTLCRAFDIVEPCSHLWCGHVKSPLVCKTKKGPPLEGTECGFDKWCVNGYCEAVDKRKFGVDPVQHNSQDGGWSEWGTWGACSRSCGTGVEFRVRRCDNPAPIYGGSDCFGLKEEWRICNSKDCPEPLRDIRAQQCRRLPRLLQLKPPRSNMTWLPYESEQYEMKCKLICTSKETKELYITGEVLIDGTPCSYENRSNICIQGTCQILGCDRKIFSSKIEDSCGICGGDNTQCISTKTTFKRRLKRDVNRVAVIPRHAREIRLEANFTTPTSDDPNIAFVLKDRKRNSFSITIPNSSTSNGIIEGAKFYYHKTAFTHVLWARGPALSEIVLLVYLGSSQVERGVNISLFSEYYLHRNASDGDRYKWIQGGWGPCSKTCGGGKRFKTKACWDNYNEKIVPRKLCSIMTKPQAKSEKCNEFSCNFHWVPGKWEACSASCGSHGLQSREIYCIPQYFVTEQSQEDYDYEDPWKFMVDPKKCGDLKPSVTRPCFRRSCPSYWEYGDWSECSSSCGLGISIRDSYCVPPVNETLYFCNELAPKQSKLCKATINRRLDATCRTPRLCFRDQSKFCSLPLLGRYCKVGGFRRMCCKSCSLQRLTPISF